MERSQQKTTGVEEKAKPKAAKPKSASARKPAAKKAPAKKTPVKKAGAKKSSAKKASLKKAVAKTKAKTKVKAKAATKSAARSKAGAKSKAQDPAKTSPKKQPTEQGPEPAQAEMLQEQLRLAEALNGAADSEARQQIADLSARVQATLFEQWQRRSREASGEEFQLVNMAGVAKSFLELGNSIMRNPMPFLEATAGFWEAQLSLVERLSKSAEEGAVPTEAVIEPDSKDRRFKDAAWSSDPVFDYLKQHYLLISRFAQSAIDGAVDLDPKVRRKVEFYTRQALSALSPTNYPMTNPQVMRRYQETQGQNLVKGLENLIADLERGKGRLAIKMTDADAFEVGRNLATTPGEVIFENELIQLIQYHPTTEKVFKRPLLIVPPWINKYYILDLRPEGSFVKWALDQGHTVFLISWVDPDEDLAQKSFDDYMLEGPLTALDVVEKATGVSEINLLGFCIGGILSASMLAYMAAKGDDRVASASFLATMVDLDDPGEVSVFIDEEQLEAIEQHTAQTGYLDGTYMADMFSMMRENDLIWSFYVNNYLMGREPAAFDLLYWNGDSTRLPSNMLLFYLKHFYLENGLAHPKQIVLDGVPIDLETVRVPTFSVATVEDHIAPWKSCHAIVKRFGGPVEFVLGGSGHVAGIVNPPAKGKYFYETNPEPEPDPERWREGATRHEGSWWPAWGDWIARHGGAKVAARKPGGRGLKSIEPAPGRYVKGSSPK